MRRKVKTNTGQKETKEDDQQADDDQQENSIEESPIGASRSTSRIELFPHIAFPTPGSALHGTGACRPCAWFWKSQGCENGSECRHCHLCPEGEIKSRRKTKVRSFRLPDDPDKSPTLQPREASAPELLLAPESPVRQLDQPARITLSITEQLFYAPTMPVKLDLATSLAPPSAGSALHGLGACRPCAWFWKPQGCLNGQACAHCHSCPAGELKTRKRTKEAGPRTALPGLQQAGGGLDPSSPRIVQIAPILGA